MISYNGLQCLQDIIVIPFWISSTTYMTYDYNIYMILCF